MYYCRKTGISEADLWYDRRGDQYSKLIQSLEVEKTPTKYEVDRALLYAAYFGRYDCVCLLIQHGADINIADGCYNDTVMLAVIGACYIENTS